MPRSISSKLAGSSSDSVNAGASRQRWHEAQTSCATGGREAGTKHQVWLVHIGVSFGERCLIQATAAAGGEQVEYFEQFGVLLALNKAAQHLHPTMPVAGAYIQHLASQLAVETTSGLAMRFPGEWCSVALGALPFPRAKGRRAERRIPNERKTHPYQHPRSAKQPASLRLLLVFLPEIWNTRWPFKGSGSAILFATS